MTYLKFRDIFWKIFYSGGTKHLALATIEMGFKLYLTPQAFPIKVRFSLT